MGVKVPKFWNVTESEEQALTPNNLPHESGDRKVKPPRAVLIPETQESCEA